MAILTVGPGLEFNTLASAVAASQNGDVIQVAAGTYVNDFATVTTNIMIEGVGGLASFVTTEPPPNLKGILTIGNANVTLDNLEFSGAAIDNGDGGNAAGVRYQGGNLVINNCYFHDNQDGLLADSDPTGTITINNSEFAGNGNTAPPSTGIEHNVYVNDIATLTITNSYFTGAVVGHEIKSRAATTIIENNRITEGPNGDGSYLIDLPNGGNATIENNVLEKGPNSPNGTMISYGEEGSLIANSSLTVSGNTLINDRGGATVLTNDTSVAASITDNTGYGLSSGQLLGGTGTATGLATNTLLPQSSEPALDTSAPYLPVLDFTIACFGAGTRIATPGGEVEVEQLRPGYVVLALEAEGPVPRVVRWIGWRSVDPAQIAEPALAWPVRVRRGALGESVPRRDLFLSPDHAVFLDGVLVPVKLLENGATIAQARGGGRIRYFHVELERHGVILAEGVPCESYLDTGNRGMFMNASGRRRRAA